MNASTATNLLHFDNFDIDASIRVLERDDSPLFVARDICAALGIVDSKKAVGDLDDDERITITPKALRGTNTHLRLPNRGLQFITESGLYALIFKSRKAAARTFRKWVTSEVLPAIRRHGRYDPAQLAAEMPPSVRRAYLLAEVEDLEVKAAILRRQADLAQVIPGQLSVWQWLLLQGEEPKGGHCANLSSRCKRLADARGIKTGVVKVIDHCGQTTRLSRTARTYPEDILQEVCCAAIS